VEKSRVFRIISVDKRIKDMLTSYEMVWATPRRAPKRAYFEFDDHPAAKMAYTFILEIQRKNKIPVVAK
jgi:hypothetical protein